MSPPPADRGPTFRRLPLAGASLLVALSLGGCRSDGHRWSGEPGSYSSTHYGFGLQFPDTLNLREYVPEFVALGRGAGNAFSAAVEVLVEQGEGDDFQAVATERARNACAANGPEISLQCVSVQQLQPATTDEGVAGIVFHLRHMVTRAGTDEVVEVGSRGPFFAFPLPFAGSAERVLFVRAPLALPPEQVDSVLVRRVAESVRIPTTTTEP